MQFYEGILILEICTDYFIDLPTKMEKIYIFFQFFFIFIQFSYFSIFFKVFIFFIFFLPFLLILHFEFFWILRTSLFWVKNTTLRGYYVHTCHSAIPPRLKFKKLSFLVLSKKISISNYIKWVCYYFIKI